MAGLVVKDNALIEASYTLDLAEQRLILLAILRLGTANLNPSRQFATYSCQ